MDDLDLFITNIVNKKVNTPHKYHDAIETAFKRNTNSKFNIIKAFSAASAGVLLTSGIVFAGYTAYENIWKNPAEYNIEKEKPPIISNEEKNNIISENEISQKATNILNTLGYSNKEIKKIDLNRSYADNSNSYYSLFTENEYSIPNTNKNTGININFDAETGKFIYFLNNDFYSQFGNGLEEISSENAINMSKETLNYVGYNLYGYEIDFCEKNSDYNEWTISFSRNYNGLSNRYDNFRIALGKINNKPVIHSIVILGNTVFDNNQFVISEEEAINIAKNKEQQFTSEEIINITAKKSIEKMNTFVYCLENNITDQNSVFVENKIRNVWLIKIEHNQNSRNVNNTLDNIDYYKKYENKIYYIDATTGEIIGGEQTIFY